MVAQNIAFGLVAAMIVVAAVRVVTTRNVVHAALYLVVVLAGVGANFLLVGAEFVGVTQVLVYIGAIVVLFLFGIMLTRAPIGGSAKLTASNWWTGLAVSIALAGVLGFTLLDAFGDDKLPEETRQFTAEVSDSIFADYLVPFEVVSILLTAALVGAIVLARRD
ncbi:NADH-quinone oxidoreductase subunit J [soil metagenome]